MTPTDPEQAAAEERLRADAYNAPIDRVFKGKRFRDEKVLCSDLRIILSALREARTQRDRLEKDLDDCFKQQGDIVGRLTDELQALEKLADDFYADDVDALRNHPDIPWGIGGKSGTEAVNEWRNDLADRIERLRAARTAATTNTGEGM